MSGHKGFGDWTRFGRFCLSLLLVILDFFEHRIRHRFGFQDELQDELRFTYLRQVNQMSKVGGASSLLQIPSTIGPNVEGKAACCQNWAKLGFAWPGLAWLGLGLAWLWPGLAWLGLAWLGLGLALARLGLAWVLAWVGLAWLGLAWLDLAWLGLAWLGQRGLPPLSNVQ